MNWIFWVGVLFGAFALCLWILAIVHFLRLWFGSRGDMGVVVYDKLKYGTYFFPRTKEAKLALDSVCTKERHTLFGGYLVPRERYWEIYEGCSHHPEYPQCMCLTMRLGRRTTLIDT